MSRAKYQSPYMHKWRVIFFFMRYGKKGRHLITTPLMSEIQAYKYVINWISKDYCSLNILELCGFHDWIMEPVM